MQRISQASLHTSRSRRGIRKVRHAHRAFRAIGFGIRPADYCRRGSAEKDADSRLKRNAAQPLRRWIGYIAV